MHYVLSFLLFLTPGANGQPKPQPQPSSQFDDGPSALAQRIADRKLSSDERGTALAALERMDEKRALEVAPALLSDQDPLIRVRAAWILADSGDETGLQLLRAMAVQRIEESAIAITMLGRLRDERAHSLLRSTLETELAAGNRPGATSRISALSKALGDYTDVADATLLVGAVNFSSNSNDWTIVNDLGKTGGREAISALDEIFGRTGQGAAVVAAGLGLGRCGSEKGIKYIRERFGSLPKGSAQPEGQEGGDGRAFASSSRGTDFIFELLGAPADEVFVPDLLQIVSQLEYPSRTRAQAWGALLRINSPKYRKETLALAWKNTIYQSAVRFIALNDELGARRVIAEAEAKGTQASDAVAEALKWALAATRHERREWRESHGYTF